MMKNSSEGSESNSALDPEVSPDDDVPQGPVQIPAPPEIPQQEKNSFAGHDTLRSTLSNTNPEIEKSMEKAPEQPEREWYADIKPSDITIEFIEEMRKSVVRTESDCDEFLRILIKIFIAHWDAESSKSDGKDMKDPDIYSSEDEDEGEDEDEYDEDRILKEYEEEQEMFRRKLAEQKKKCPWFR